MQVSGFRQAKFLLIPLLRLVPCDLARTVFPATWFFYGTARQTAEKSNVFLGCLGSDFSGTALVASSAVSRMPDFGCPPRHSSGASLLGASGVACGVQDSLVEGERPVSSCARVLDDTSGGNADVDGELLERNAGSADCVFRVLPVVSCARGLALVPAVSTAAASPGSKVLRVLGGGHSADRGGCSGAGVAACSSGVERLRRQACSSLCGVVGVFDSLSSHHVDRVRSRGV